MKKALREMQTLHAGCSKAEPKMFALPQTPFPGARDGQNLISWRQSLPLSTNPVWWGSMHAISSYRGSRPANKHTHTYKHTNPHTGPITIHCAAALLARSVITINEHSECLWLTNICIRSTAFRAAASIWYLSTTVAFTTYFTSLYTCTFITHTQHYLYNDTHLKVWTCCEKGWWWLGKNFITL